MVRPQSVTTTFELPENMGTKTAGDTSTFTRMWIICKDFLIKKTTSLQNSWTLRQTFGFANFWWKHIFICACFIWVAVWVVKIWHPSLRMGGVNSNTTMIQRSFDTLGRVCSWNWESYKMVFICYGCHVNCVSLCTLNVILKEIVKQTISQFIIY